MSKTLERLQVLLTADDSNLKGTLGKAAGRMEGFSNKLRGVAQVAKPVAGAVAAIGAAAVGAALKTGRMADQLLDLSEQTGLTTDQLQEYRRVTNQAGVDTDVVARAAEQMTLRFSRGAEGSADLRQGLAQLGISAKDAQGNIRPMSEIVDEAIVGLSGMEDETQRNILATKLFSRGASDLAPVLGLGADEISRLRGEAHELGLVLSGDQLEAANRFRQSWDGVKQELGGVVTQVGSDLVPTLQKLADNIQGSWRPIIEGVADSFVFVVEAAVGFGDNLQRIWIGIQGIALHFVTGIVDKFAQLGEAIPFLGERIAIARDQFQQWSDMQMAGLRDRMNELTASTNTATAAIDDQTAAAARNARAMSSMAGSAVEAAKFEEVGLLNLTNTLQTASIAHDDLETVAVGSSANIEIQASGAFQRMSSAVSGSAYKVLGAVQQVLQKLTGGGGFLGGITGAIGGFLSGGPLGAALGFVGGFAEGGTIPRGGVGLVGENGPELVTAGIATTVTPMGDMRLRIDPSSIPDGPVPLSPEAAAISAWYRQLFSEMVLDGKTRGVL